MCVAPVARLAQMHALPPRINTPSPAFPYTRVHPVEAMQRIVAPALTRHSRLPPSKEVCHMFTDRLQIFNLFQAPDSAEANCGADGAQYSAQFTTVRP